MKLLGRKCLLQLYDCIQELEKGVDVLLEQYKGIVEEQEEEVQSGAPTTAPVRSTKHNRQPVRGIIMP